jgi:CBS-domain-containing membrane protein
MSDQQNAKSSKLYAAVVGAIGAGLAIALMIALAHAAHLEIAAVPFVTSIVLVMAAPFAPQAQPRNLIGGHLICAFVGLTVLTVGGGNVWLAPIAIALSVAAMQLTDTMHPPAGINAVLAVVLKPTWMFLLVPVASGAVILAVFAYLYHRLTAPGIWPTSRTM